MNIFHKEDYNNVVREKRQEFVHTHFSEVLAEVFQKLRDNAYKRKPCHQEVAFNIPEHFDVLTIENILLSYFSDIGYNAIPEPRKPGEDETLIFTLT